MESIARYVDGLKFEATFSTGHTITMDTRADQGGADEGPRPVEMVLAGLAGCTGMDVLAILRKKRQEVKAFTCPCAGGTAGGASEESSPRSM